MSVNPVFPDVFQGGQMTDLPVFAGTLDGTELVEIVAAPTGQSNAAAGVNYQVSTLLLAQLLPAITDAPTIILAGATPGSPYLALATNSRVLFNKTVGADSGVNIGGAVARNNIPVMVRDIKGDADVHNITVSFTGTCDGLASPIIIASAFGGYVFNPLPSGNWYLSAP